MRQLVLLILLLPAPQAVKASSHPEDWELAWSDEFDGPEIDKAKWKYETGGHGFGNNEQQFYTDPADNSFVDGRALVIPAHAEKFPNRNYTSANMQNNTART